MEQTTMKACMLTEYNKLEIAEVPIPRPGYGEILCKIKAIAICGTDPEIINGHHSSKWPPYFPFTLGHEWSGQVVEVGEGVTEFKPGDRVAGEAHCGCGKCENCMKGNYTLCLNYGKDETGHRHYGFTVRGANAEYNVYSPKALKKIPDSLSYKAATLVDTAGVALHGIELVGITPGGTVAVFGPGPIGLCAMQIAKHMGADKVIMVGRGHRLEVAKQLGADEIIDFEKEDPIERIREMTQGVGADEVLECSGAAITPYQSVMSVRKGGKVSLIGFYDDEKCPLYPQTKIVLDEIKIFGSRANPNVSERVIKMLAAGVISSEIIVTHCYPLEKYNEALDVMVNRKDGVIKMVILA